ncbi:MAG: ABC transporter ATP-binding protein [Clostridia bacterium]|nr:ABC transporter ATP-binding protein [Clostridia bacterium]
MELKIENISKSYKKGKKALCDFSVTLNTGVYGLLGANGAGKSTLMNIITDNLKADSGEIYYNGANVRKLGKKYRSVLGYMPQQQGLYDDFTANRFLWYMAALKGLDKKTAKQQITKLLKQVNLQNDAHKRLGDFSGGMKQRILIAQALLGSPEILILDEPTAGLDPRERIRIRNFISEIADNKIVILVTHVVSDIECIADKVILMKDGKLIKNDSPSGLIASITDKVFELPCQKSELEALQKEYSYGNVIQRKDEMLFRIVGDDCPKNFRKSRNDISLEDVYLYYFEYSDIKK